MAEESALASAAMAHGLEMGHAAVEAIENEKRAMKLQKLLHQFQGVWHQDTCTRGLAEWRESYWISKAEGRCASPK